MDGRSGVAAALQTAGYRIEAVIGRGGIGTVYRAVQLRLQRDVALKLLIADRDADPSFRAQFLEESVLTASLDHPNIVPVYDAGEVEEMLYIAMRYVPGSDLQAMVRREGHLSPHAAVEILGQVASALDAAHAAGIVHRDVKPSNVLIAGDHGGPAQAHAWLGDFGIGRRVVDPTESTADRPLGSVHYVAPEQIRGEHADARADVYSLGCLLYECLTGQVPFSHTSVAAVLYAHLEAEPAPVSSLGLHLPESLDEVLAWAMAKAPERRPETAGELARAAARALGGRPAPVSGDTLPITGDRLPRRRQPRATRPLFGRVAESEDLLSLLQDALAGAGAVAMLSGEAGIGKTALARQCSALAEQRGIPAVWGVGASAEAARPYWHWIQVIRAIAARREGREVLSALGADAGRLATIGPDLDLDLPPAPPTASDEGRFLVYDALLRLLGAAARRTGLLVVLDDLQLADEASLTALSYVSRALIDHRILIVCTARDLELEHARRGLTPFSELVRPTLSITLKGLSPSEVGRMIEAQRGRAAPTELVARIHALTGGNPLFVSELLSLIEAHGDLDDSLAAVRALPLPTGVRDAIAARLALLSPDAREALSAAAVMGQRFRAGPLSAATEIPPVSLLTLLDEAVRLRLIVPVSDSPDAYAFDHGLIGATLNELLEPGRRIALHHAIALALEREHDQEAGDGLAEIAHHHLEAAPVHGPRDAVQFARRAGDGAMARFAYGQAAGLYRRALAVAPGGADRGALLQSLGEAQMRLGDTVAARRNLIAAANAARAADEPVAFACAVLGCGIWGLTNGTDAEVVRLAEEAVHRLSEAEHPELRARALGFLASSIYWTDDVVRRERLAEEALALARRQHALRPGPDTGETLGYVMGRYLLARWGPLSAQRDLPCSDEAVKLAREIGDGELELLVRNWRVTVLLELGRFADVDLEIARVEQMAQELRQPRAMVFLPLHHAIRSASAGRFDEAIELNARSAEIGREVHGSVSELAGSAQLLTIRLLEGRLPELEQPLRGLTATRPELVGYRCALAAMLAQAGRAAEARDELERLTARGLEGFPRDCTHLVMLALAGETAADIGDGERARRLYEWLAPYRGRWVVSAGASALWPVDRSLGRLGAVAGMIEPALAHTAAARAEAERVGAQPSIVLCGIDEARALHARGRREDRPRIRELAADTLMRAQQLGMGLVVDIAVSLDVELDLGSGAG